MRTPKSLSNVTGASVLADWGKSREMEMPVDKSLQLSVARRINVIKKVLVVAICLLGSDSMGQVTRLIDGFEFATSDAAATAGVTDITDFENQPTFYTNGNDPEEGGATEGFFSLGTDALFGASGIFVPGSFIGFRRQIDTELYPTGEVTLLHTYGDPNVTGPIAADKPLGELQILGDFYGSEQFGKQLIGTHLWINLIDAEGERFNFINYSEFSLFQEGYTLDVVVGNGLVRIAPDTISDVPNGDRLLTEIVAFEVLIQDENNPPAGEGKWYIDNLRIREPVAADVPGDADGDGDVDAFDMVAYVDCDTGPQTPTVSGCEEFDFDHDGDVDFSDFAAFQRFVTEGF